MPNFIAGIPAQGSPLTSFEIRENFLALNARTGKITPRADNPASTSLFIDAGVVYFSDNIVLSVSPQSIDLGSATTGISSFTNTGYFRDVALVLRLSFESSRYVATLAFVEGPEKASSVSQPELINIRSSDLPIARFVVRHNGINNIDKGQIEPITQTQILDYRNYLTVGSTTYYSITVGDRETQVDAYGTLQVDAYGVPLISGMTVGDFSGSVRDAYGDLVSSIQLAIDSLGDTGGTVFIKKGTYSVTQSLLVPANIQLIGEGHLTVIEMQDVFTGPLFSVTGSNVTFSDLTIKGTLPSTLVASEALIKFIGSSNCLVKNCYIKDGITGVEFDSATRNICTNNFFESNSVAVALISGSTNNIVSSNQFISNTTDITGSSGNMTLGNILSTGI